MPESYKHVGKLFIYIKISKSFLSFRKKKLNLHKRKGSNLMVMEGNLNKAWVLVNTNVSIASFFITSAPKEC